MKRFFILTAGLLVFLSACNFEKTNTTSNNDFSSTSSTIRRNLKEPIRNRRAIIAVFLFNLEMSNIVILNLYLKNSNKVFKQHFLQW